MTLSTMIQWLSSGALVAVIPAIVLRWESAAHHASLTVRK